MPWIDANRKKEDVDGVPLNGQNCRPARNDGDDLLTHGIAIHFERRAAAAEIDAVAEEVLTAERKPDTYRVLKRPGEAVGIVLTVAVSPHRRIEHRA